MLRVVFASLSVFAISFSTANAEEVKGKVKSVNQPGNALTLTVDGKDKVFAVSKDASFVSVSSMPGKKGKPMETVTPIDDGLKGIKVGSPVTVLTEKVEDKVVVTSVKVTGADQPAKKKKKAKNPTATSTRLIAG
jgi:hypothetical protein